MAKKLEIVMEKVKYKPAPTGSEIKLMDLNDDCLLELFKYLTLPELFLLIGQMNSRIDALAYKTISNIKSFKIVWRDGLDYKPNQLRVIGKYLRCLEMSIGYEMGGNAFSTVEALLEGAMLSCSMQKLSLHYVHIDEKYLKLLKAVVPQLRFLDLSFCRLEDQILGPILLKAKNLEDLIIVGNYMLKGESLWTINSVNMKSLQYETHENFSLDVRAFSKIRPNISIIAHEKGRISHVKHGN